MGLWSGAGCCYGSQCANPGASVELEPMDFDLKDLIKKLAEKAVECKDGGDAMRFSQAATNVANAMVSVSEIERRTS